MAKTQPDISSGLNWLGTMLQYIKEYGMLNIIRAIALFILLFLTLKICYDPSFLFDTYQKYKENKHAIETLERTEADKRVKMMLPTYLYKYHSDRVGIIQCHNGISDGRYGSMRFEVCQEGVHSIKEEYEDFHLSGLDLYYYLEDNMIFIGSTDELKSIDATLYNRFQKNGVKFVACIMLQDDSGHPIGVLGHTGTTDVNVADFKGKLRDYLIEDRGAIKEYLKPISYK